MTREEHLADTSMWLAQRIVQTSMDLASKRRDNDSSMADQPLVKLSGTATLRINGVRHVATISVEAKEY